jgi:DNA repair exonuclease SbcCD ATPase subunit
MRITSIAVRNYRTHRDLKVELDGSLTLIGGPNEVGKSTLVEAVHRALFLRAKVTGETQKSMVSDLHAGHPEVAVCFEAGGRSYCITKRFSGATGYAMLAEMNGQTWHGDDAESRLAETLGVETAAGGRGAADRASQQWAHLWVWQGHAGKDPLEHAASQRDSLLARLQDSGGAAAMQSELDAVVAEAIANRHATIFNKNLAPKRDSDLGRARQDNESALTALAEAKQTLERLHVAVTGVLDAERTILSTRSSLEKLQPELAAVSQKLSEVRALRAREQTQSLVAENAIRAHDAIATADEKIRNVRARIQNQSAALTPKNEETVRLTDKESDCDALAKQADSAYQVAIETTRSARLRYDLAAAHAARFERAAQRDNLLAKLDQVNDWKRSVAGFEAELARLPAITAAQLDAIRELESASSAADATLRAMAAGIEVLSSELIVQIGDVTLEVGQPRILTEDTEVAIGSATRLRITPGGGTSLSEARRTALDAQNRFRQELNALGITSTVEAVTVRARRQQLETEIIACRARLAGLGGETIEDDLSEANNACIAAESEVQHRATLAGQVSPPEDKAASEALMLQTAQQLRDAETEESRCKSARDSASQEAAAARETLAGHLQALREENRMLDEAKVELRLLLDSHGDDADRHARLAELLDARRCAANELAHLRQQLDQLQPDLLENDHVRLNRAIEQCNSERGQAETQREVARHILQSDGAADPQAAVALADARRRLATEHLASVERRAQAINLLHDLFRQEQRALAERFTRPLAEKINGYLQCLFGARVQTRVRLEENAFVGLELVRPGQGAGALAFESLSAGAREQVAAAVRLAMAEILAADHDNCLPLVFDDSFAYSDPDRVTILQRMLDRAASRGLQLIVLSCNPSDYAALGATTIILCASVVSNPN